MHEPQEAKFAFIESDILAKHACKVLSSVVWLRYIPNFAVRLLVNDVTLHD